MKLHMILITAITYGSISQKIYSMNIVRTAIKSCLKKTSINKVEPTADTAATQDASQEIAKPQKQHTPAKKVWINQHRAQVHVITRYKHPRHYDRDNSSDEDDELEPPLVLSSDDDLSSGSESDSDDERDAGNNKNEFRDFTITVLESMQKLEASNAYAKLTHTEAARAILKDLKLDDESYFKSFCPQFQSRFKWALEKTILKWLAHQESMKHAKTKAQIDLRLVFLSFMS